jgi:cardiolipin synthase A/B
MMISNTRLITAFSLPQGLATSILLLICTLMQSCAVIPDHERALENINAQSQQVEIVGAKDSLSQAKVDKALQKLTPDEQSLASLENHLKIEQSISDSHLYADNAFTLLINGESTFGKMKELIGRAEKNIHLEYFTFEDVDLGGATLKALLLKKLAKGVEVHVIYDAYGSQQTPPDFFETLKKAGAKITVFHPLEGASLKQINQRDHRKILIVDGKVAIIGGVNLSKTYQSKGSFKTYKKETPNPLTDAAWRDMDVMIQGPILGDIQRIFLENWDQTQPLDQTHFFPKLNKQGNQFARVIATPATKRKDTDSPYYLSMLSAIESAEDRILINAAYFVPTKAQLEALVKAANRGVRVELMVPSFTDSTLSLLVQRSRYSLLLENHIAIYEMQGQVLHAKTITIDGVWSAIGSSNFDYRSAGLNAEVDVVILGKEIANGLEDRFKQDIKDAKKIELEQWQKRGFLDRINQQSARIFEGFL